MEPTLIIGLGGTGKEVLLRIRRRFFMSGYSVQPWVSYLWVDTAARQPHERYARALPKDYVTRCTLLKDEEICDIGVTQAEASNLNTAKMSWLNIWEWAEPEGVQPALDAQGLENGAKQQPPLGRLAVFVKAGGKNGLLSTLAARLEQLDHAKVAERNKLLPDDLKVTVPNDARLKIIFVGSLAGGTGAGCCIRLPARGCLRLEGWGALGTCTRRLAKFNLLKDAPIYGFYVLADAFCNDNTSRQWTHFDAGRVRANSHAMLQEIENLSLRRGGAGQFLTGREKAGSIHATWSYPSNIGSAPWVDVAPLYNNVFLFDGYGEGNSRLTKIEDSYELVSNLLFNDLQGRNKAIEAARSNETYQSSRGHIEMVPQESVDFKDAIWSDVYSFVFATAGNAQVTFDAPKLRLTGAYAIAKQAILDWLGEGDLDPRIKDDETKVATRRNAWRC